MLPEATKQRSWGGYYSWPLGVGLWSKAVRGVSGKGDSPKACMRRPKGVAPRSKAKVGHKGRLGTGQGCIRREERGGGEGLQPKVCVLKMAQINFSSSRFHFFPL